MDLLHFLKIVARVEHALLKHLHIALIGAQPLFEGLSLFADVDSGALSLLEKAADALHVFLVFEGDVVVVSIVKPFALIRLNDLLGHLDELNDSLCPVDLPKNVLDDRVVFEHGQNFQVVFMLPEKLFPES